MSDLRMPDLNKVIIAGRLTRDPELKYTASSKPFAKLSIVNSRKYKDKEESCFVDCTLWGQSAEYVSENLGKGDAVIVEGRLSQSEWEDKATGQKRTRIEIQAVTCTPLQWKGNSQSVTQPTNHQRNPQATKEAVYAPTYKEDAESFDIPF